MTWAVVALAAALHGPIPDAQSAYIDARLAWSLGAYEEAYTEMLALIPVLVPLTTQHVRAPFHSKGAPWQDAAAWFLLGEVDFSLGNFLLYARGLEGDLGITKCQRLAQGTDFLGQAMADLAVGGFRHDGLWYLAEDRQHTGVHYLRKAGCP